jgi:CheY-like chemotaxis protein
MDAPTPSPVSTPIAPITPVLVASGNDALRRSVRMSLEDEGYEVMEVASVARAVAYLHFASAPHIVLLDYQLPPGTAEPLLHVVGLDAALQRHRYVLTTPTKPLGQFSYDLQRLITTRCAVVVQHPFQALAQLAAVKYAAAQLPANGLTQ